MSEQFHLHEYTALRFEILEKSKQIDGTFRFMLAAVAASTTWIISNIGTLSSVGGAAVAWVPFFLSFSLFWHRKDIGRSIRRTGGYIFLLEEHAADKGLGWEHHIHPKNDGKSLNWYSSAKVIWRVIIALTFIFGALLSAHFLMLPGAIFAKWHGVVQGMGLPL